MVFYYPTDGSQVITVVYVNFKLYQIVWLACLQFANNDCLYPKFSMTLICIKLYYLVRIK